MFKDESVDCYIAPLVLHLVENPEKMLKEALRVLKKGGVFGFSVLGRAEDGTYYKMFDELFKELGKQGPEKRSMHHLGDKKDLVQIVKDSGLEVKYCWNENVI